MKENRDRYAEIVLIEQLLNGSKKTSLKCLHNKHVYSLKLNSIADCRRKSFFTQVKVKLCVDLFQSGHSERECPLKLIVFHELELPLI